GSSGNNVMFGGSGNQLLQSGGAGDIMIGGSGQMTLSSSAGSGVLIFDGTGADTVIVTNHSGVTVIGDLKATDTLVLDTTSFTPADYAAMSVNEVTLTAATSVIPAAVGFEALELTIGNQKIELVGITSLSEIATFLHP